MIESLINRNIPLLKLTVFLMSAASTLLGLMVVVGWLTHNESLIQINSSFVAMQFNTAICFILGGMALGLYEAGFEKVVVFISSALLLLGFVTLSQYLTGYSYGLDEFFIKHYITTQASHPGRMAPNTAFCFSISGASLLLMSINRRFHAWSMLGIIVAGLGAIAASGYITGIETSYGWGKYTRMAIHTAMGFFVLGVGLILAGVERSDLSLNENQKRIQLIMLVSLLVLVTTLWQSLSAWKSLQIKDEAQSVMRSFERSLQVKLSLQNQALARLLDRQLMQIGTSELEWSRDALNYINDFKGVEALAIYTKSSGVQKAMPLALSGLMNELGATNLTKDFPQFTNNPLQSISAYRHLNSEALKLNKKLLVVIRPKDLSDYEAYLLALVDAEKIINQVFNDAVPERFNFQLSSASSGDIVFGNENFQNNPSYLLTSTFESDGLHFLIQVWPKPEFLKNGAPILPNIVLFFGLMLSLAIMFAYHEFFKAKNVMHELEGQIKLRESAEAELLKSNEKLRLIAEHDILTGLANRYLFGAEFTKAIRRCSRSQTKFALIELDLDGFKEVNDSYGHQVGDSLLIHVARRIERLLRVGDLASRVGGDEFLILINDVNSLAGLEVLAKRILSAISEQYDLGDIKIHISVSIGVSVFPDNGKTEEVIYRKADEAMYRAKKLGKNQYQFA